MKLEGRRIAPVMTKAQRKSTHAQGGTCHKCGTTVKVRLERHLKRCDELPTAEEIDAMLQDPRESIDKISKRIRVFNRTIKGILLNGDNDWTDEKLRQHGHNATSLLMQDSMAERKRRGKQKYITVKGPRCICGMLIPKKGDMCEFCTLELNGIKSYHDMWNV